VAAGVAPPPQADNKSPSTVMNENSVTDFFMALLLLLKIFDGYGRTSPDSYFDYRD
jgi:hypothetical protein